MRQLSDTEFAGIKFKNFKIHPQIQLRDDSFEHGTPLAEDQTKSLQNQIKNPAQYAAGFFDALKPLRFFIYLDLAHHLNGFLQFQTTVDRLCAVGFQFGCVIFQQRFNDVKIIHVQLA